MNSERHAYEASVEATYLTLGFERLQPGFTVTKLTGAATYQQYLLLAALT